MFLHRLCWRRFIAVAFLAATLHAADQDGLTPLHRAVETDDVPAAAKLLQSRAPVNTPTRNGITPLWLAVMNRNSEMVELLLKAGADPNGALPSGETILMTAARTGNSEVADALIKRGAKVSATGPAFGETALMLAAGENHASVIKVLLQHGAEVNGRSAKLDYAKDRFGLEGVLTILPHGSWTPLMYAAREGALDAARALTEAGAELNAADNEGTTPLLLAITNSHYDTAALLIEKGADVNLGDTTGMGPLFAATDMNTLGEVFGRPTRVSRDKLTALDAMKVLLDRGANPNAGLKTTTLQRAHTPGEPSLNEGATPLARAARSGDVAAIDLLISRGANPSQALKNGTTPLMFAMGLGRGTSAFAKDSGTEADWIAAAKLLLDKGADINAVSAAGQTAVHFAAQATDANFPAPSDDMLKLLIARGAKLDVVDKQGRSPIEMAEGKGLRGRAGGPVKARESTIELLRSLQARVVQQ